ncbi:MAG: ATP-binding protein [Segetibacter sp.]
MNTQNTLEQMQKLNLYGMIKQYEAILGHPIHEHPESHTLLGMLTEAETQYRSHKRTTRNLSRSKLRYNALPEQIHCGSERGISKEQLLQLCDGTYIEKGETVLISGSTGTGKSFLACALGRQACLNDYSTLYFSMSRFIETISAARLDGTYVKLVNQIARAPLLILDDFGLNPLDHKIRLTLLEMKEFERLSFINNLQLKMHTSMCSGCRDYMKQSKLINELLNKSRSTSVVVENTEELEEPNTKKLTRL